MALVVLFFVYSGQRSWHRTPEQGCQRRSFTGGFKVCALGMYSLSTTFFCDSLEILMLTMNAFYLFVCLLHSPFFVQPVFRDDGYFMMVSQFMEPSHFLMAYLEDFKMDPARAQPLLTFSVFDDYAEDKGITLVRADIMNRGIEEDEGLKIVNSMLDGYTKDEEYMVVKAFNKNPATFDLDDFVSRQGEKWREGTPTVDTKN